MIGIVSAKMELGVIIFSFFLTNAIENYSRDFRCCSRIISNALIFLEMLPNNYLNNKYFYKLGNVIFFMFRVTSILNIFVVQSVTKTHITAIHTLVATADETIVVCSTTP